MAIELPSQDPCYFCEIIAGRADQWNVIAETDITVTLLNGRQYEIGQCVVVPKRHAPTLLDLDPAESHAILQDASNLSEILIQAYDPDGILLYQNNGVGSGQEVPHFHLHVVPRQPGSDWGLGPPHLARLGANNNDEKLDHTIVTGGKRTTALQLRDLMCASECLERR